MPSTAPSPTPAIIHLGTDLVYLPRLVRAKNRHGMRFFERLLSPDELHYCQAHAQKWFIQRAASRIATKEAVAKALGTGLNGLGWGQGLSWQEITVASTPQHPPQLVLHGAAQQIAQQQGIVTWQLSLSHDGDYAVATVIGL